MMATQRDEKIDFYKGLLMVGVIWGHVITNLLCGEPNNISIHWIFRTYDMPMFMLLSGYFLQFSIQKYSVKQLLMDKITTILVPSSIVGLIIARSPGGLFVFYFLWAVFLSSVVVILCCMVKNRGVRNILLLLSILALHLVDRFNMSYLYPFFVLGYWGVGMHVKEILKKYFIPVFVILLCFFSTRWTIWNVPGDLRQVHDLQHAGIILYRLAIGFVGCVTMMKVFDVLYLYMSLYKGFLYSFIVKSGKETLALYMLQQVACFTILYKVVEQMGAKLGYNILNFNECFLGYVIAPCCTFIFMLIILKFVEWVKSNSHTKFIFGFKYKLKE